MSTPLPDPAVELRRHREAMAKNAALLRRNMANVDANGHQRPPATVSPERQRFMATVMSKNTREIGGLVDHLLDRIDALEAEIANTTKENDQ